jgi:hypothetical protein
VRLLVRCLAVGGGPDWRVRWFESAFCEPVPRYETIKLIYFSFVHRRYFGHKRSVSRIALALNDGLPLVAGCLSLEVSEMVWGEQIGL